jgi:bacteriocin biosynthesis cyclodehydratase domain-containing protein
MPDSNVLLTGEGAFLKRCSVFLRRAQMQVVTVEPEDSVEAPLDQYKVVVFAGMRPPSPVCFRLASICWDAGVPWVFGALLAHEFWAGPVIIPEITPCFECYDRRVQSLCLDIQAEDALRAFSSRNRSDPLFAGELPALTDEAAALVAASAVEVVSSAHRSSDSVIGHYLVGNAVSGRRVKHLFPGIGRCRRCAGRTAQGASDELENHFRERWTGG